MKHLFFTLNLLLGSLYSFADNERVCVLSNSTSICSKSSLGYVNPCATLNFIVNFQIPSGYIIVDKYEWYVNNVLVKINTTNPSDIGLIWQIKSPNTTVYCKVYYKKQNDDLSEAYTSSAFTPDVKQVNFPDNGILATTPMPNYGCTSGAVSFSLNTFSCTQFCDAIYNVSQYQISWQPPSGWSQTSISANGNTVSFMPDATTAGNLTATITLPCGYTETRTYNITRAVESPVFADAPNPVCTSTAAYSVNAVCGATGYTYTIVGNSGITFAGNGLQTFTTTSTSPVLNFIGSGASFTLKAKANFSGGISSSESITQSYYGVLQPGAIQVTNIDLQLGRIEVEVDDAISGGPYNWYKNGSLISSYHSYWAKIPITRNVCDVDYGISVETANTCGTSAQSFTLVYVPCEEYYIVSPNPGAAEMMVAVDQTKTRIGKNAVFEEIRIYDQVGNLKMTTKYPGVKSARINLSGLPVGAYFIEIKNGTYKESKQIKVQR